MTLSSYQIVCMFLFQFLFKHRQLLNVIQLISDDKNILFFVDFSSNAQKTKQENVSEYNNNRDWNEYNQSLQNRSKKENNKSSGKKSSDDNETDNENNAEDIGDEGYETIAASELMDYVRAMTGTDYLGPQITFLDFAGQKMYYSYHQIYLSPGTFYILVVDMTKKPDDQVEVSDEKGCTRFDSWTYKGIQLYERL